MQTTLRVGVIGAGVLGGALARLLAARGYPVVAVSSRRIERAQALAQAVGAEAVRLPHEVAARTDLVLLTIPDDQIAPVVAEVARVGGWRAGQAVVHTSGSLDRSVLRLAAERGAWIGGLHPLQSAADPEEAVRALPGSYFGVEAEEPLLGLLETLVSRLGGKLLRVPGEAKDLYHLAAALASNGIVALFALAADLFDRAGIPSAESSQALLPLLRGTLENLERLGLPRALTGPISRGDHGTLLRHLDSLGREAPELIALYCLLGRRMVALARAKGSLDDDGARRMLHALAVAEGREPQAGREIKEKACV